MAILEKSIWVRADWEESWENRKKYVTSALEAGADGVVVKEGDLENARKLGDITLISQSRNADIFLIKAETPSEIDEAISKMEDEKGETSLIVEISGKEMEKAATKAGEVVDYLVMIGKDWKVIPLENLLAELQDERSNVLTGVRSAEEAKTAIETLEIGADGVLLDPRNEGLEVIRQTCEAIEELESRKIELTACKITRIEPAGMGDRACIDTSSLMNIGEGMLIGSQSDGLFLVHSETLETEYVEARPFRVNAGGVHAYIQTPSGKTKYLSELESGDEVLIVNSKGETEKAIVGRVKIERRPMLLIEAEHDGKKVKTLLQNAETINLVDSKGEPISVAELEPGDEVLVNLQEGGRHFGAKVDETLIEK
ncbi:MAG: 3-dehydroquinate synthase II [Candidatus Hadarchaeota archaeon]